MGGSHSAFLESAAARGTARTGRKSETLVVGLGSSASERDDGSGVRIAGSSRYRVVQASSAPADGIAWRLERRNCSTREMISPATAGSSSPAVGLWVYTRETVVAAAYFRSAKDQLVAFEEKLALGTEAWKARAPSKCC